MMTVAARHLSPAPTASPRDLFAADAIRGLTARPKQLPPKYFYDDRGSSLFEAITRVPEYYPTRAEVLILERFAREIARELPPDGALVEFGAGSTAKVRALLPHLPALGAYVPVDISGPHLEAEAARLQRDFPHLAVRPVIADFTSPFALPPETQNRFRAGFFPGSTIGNFEPDEAETLLGHCRRTLGTGATLVIGVDLVKDAAVLNAAYDDAAGVTAAFNLNLLARMNRELGGTFDLEAFEHRAFFSADESRVEMHLVSRRAQTVHVCGVPIRFEAGESIHTENSYKYTVPGFQALADRAGWSVSAVWTDPDHLFAVLALKDTGSAAA